MTSSLIVLPKASRQSDKPHNCRIFGSNKFKRCLYITMGNQAGACVRLEKILKEDPRNPNALAWLSRLNAK